MIKARNYKFIVVVITVGQAQLFTNQLVRLENHVCYHYHIIKRR